MIGLLEMSLLKSTLKKAAAGRGTPRPPSPFLAIPLNSIAEADGSLSPLRSSPLSFTSSRSGGGSASAHVSPVPFGRGPHMREYLNQTEGECQWGAGPTSTERVPCGFPTPVKEEGGWFSVTLEPGFMLYRSEKHAPGKSKWFNTTAISETVKDHYWFATTLKHVQVFGGSHILHYEVMAPIKLLFIQNLYTQKGFKDGYDYFKSPKFVKEMREYGVDGYAGCNECEILLTTPGLLKISQMPKKVEDLTPYISGGSRKIRRNRGRRSSTRRRQTR